MSNTFMLNGFILECLLQLCTNQDTGMLTFQIIKGPAIRTHSRTTKPQDDWKSWQNLNMLRMCQGKGSETQLLPLLAGGKMVRGCWIWETQGLISLDIMKYYEDSFHNSLDFLTFLDFARQAPGAFAFAWLQVLSLGISMNRSAL